MPKVTVIVTVYKRIEFLRIALQSALDQTFQDFEIVVTDDSNSEAIRKISESFGSEKIRYRTQTKNLGVALNLRAAVAEAKGTYIAILNDDDLWEPHFLEKLVAPLEADQKCALAFSDHWLINGAGEIQFPETDANSRTFGRSELPAGDVANLADLVLHRNGVPLAMAAVFRADAIDWTKVVTEVSGAYDYWISMLIAAARHKAWYVPERLTRYRVHEAMETGRRAPDKHEHLIYMYYTLLQTNSMPLHKEVLQRALAAALYLVGKDSLCFDQAREARGYLGKSLSMEFKARTLALLCISCFPTGVRAKAVARLQPAVIHH